MDKQEVSKEPLLKIIQKPSVGRVVHYAHEKKAGQVVVFMAFVCRLFRLTPGRVDRIWDGKPLPTDTLPNLSVTLFILGDEGFYNLEEVPYSEWPGIAGTWSWPPQVRG